MTSGQKALIGLGLFALLVIWAVLAEMKVVPGKVDPVIIIIVRPKS